VSELIFEKRYYAFARQSLAATVAKSWYLVVETDRLQGLAEQAVRYTGGRFARLKYTVGAMDMLSVLQLQEGLLQSRAKLIQLRFALLANRINLHLALGGGFDAAPASVIAN
jgi:outer membrane protein TolC